MDAVPKGQAEGSVMQPRRGKQGYFPVTVVAGFFFKIYTFTQQTLEPELFLPMQHPEGAHMLYLPSH